MSQWKNRLKPFFVILALGVGACGVARLAGDKSASGRIFSHKIHVTDQALECSTCHTKAEKEDHAGMPAGLKKCMVCHEGGDEEKPENRKLAALVGEKPEWSNVTAMPEDVKFSHKRHVTDAKVACNECHKGIESSTGITDEVALNMDTCMDCHTKKNASNECSTCHTSTRLETPPPNHRLNWKQNHGPVMRTADDGFGNKCSLCHTQESCEACHSIEAPASHTDFWRHRMHTISAQTDRSQCATCHRDDFCDRCHRDTAPVTHKASWGAPQDQHCLSCHDNPDPTSCTFCHKEGTPSHNDAADKPSWHNSGMNCRQCHGNGQPLPHPDNGDNCNDCHR